MEETAREGTQQPQQAARVTAVMASQSKGVNKMCTPA